MFHRPFTSVLNRIPIFDFVLRRVPVQPGERGSEGLCNDAISQRAAFLLVNLVDDRSGELGNGWGNEKKMHGQIDGEHFAQL